jgi:type II secretory pathway pseudopilin PulG
MLIDMKHSGFTVVELIVIITVMGILLVIGVVNLSGAEASSRDAERKADIETIATHLETYYGSGTDGSTSVGQYPSVQPSTGLIGNETTFLRDIDTDSLKTPGAANSSLIAATNNTQTVSGIAPQPTISQYIYQPIATDGSLCDNSSTKECRKFNLFYTLETDNNVYMITSRNQ